MAESPPVPRSTIARSVRWNTIARLSTSGIQFVGTLVLARLLRPEDFGAFALALVFVGVLQEFADSGFANAIIRDGALAGEVVSTVYWLNLALGVLLAAGLVAAAPLAAAFYDQPDLARVLRWCSAVFVVSPAGNLYSWLLRRDLAFRTIALTDVSAGIVWIVVTVALAATGAGVAALVGGFVARAVWRSAWYMGVSRRRYPGVAGRCDAGQLRRQRLLLRFAGFQLLERASYFLGNNVDSLVIGKVLGVGMLGYYTIAYNLMIAMIRFVTPLATSVSFPVISRWKHKPDAVRASYQTLLSFYSAALVPVLALCVGFAPQIFHVLYGARWDASVALFQLICVTGLIYGYRALGASMLQVVGRAELSFVGNVVSVIGFAVASYVGARAWGIRGVAVGGVVVSVCVLFPFDCFWRRRYFGMSLGLLAGNTGIYLLLAAAAMTGGWVASSFVSPRSPLVQLLAGGSVFSALYLVLLHRARPDVTAKIMELAGWSNIPMLQRVP